MGTIRSFLLLAAVACCFILIGHVLALHAGILIGVLLSIVMVLRAFFYSDKGILLALNAKKLEGNVLTDLSSVIQPLCAKANIPTPALYVIDTDAANVCAVGRNPERASLCITQGLLQGLTKNELTAVLAQKISQIANKDTFLDTIATSMADVVLQLADRKVWYAVVGETIESKINPTAWRCLAVISSLVIRASIPKLRTLDQDRLGAQLCGDSLALSSALEKLEAQKNTNNFNVIQARPAFATIFIINPLIDPKLSAQFSRQASIEERLKQLSTMRTVVQPA